MRLVCLFLATSLTACGTLPANEVQVVDKAVAVSCVQNLPPTPGFHTDTELKAMPDYQVVIILLSERIQREIYEAKLTAALQACQ
jgi:ketol-acid reductoisomerase